MVLLDTESTDFDRQLVKIGITDVYGTALFSSLVRPTTPVAPGARAVHGINDEELQDAPNLRASRLPGARHRAVEDCRSLAEVLQELAAD